MQFGLCNLGIIPVRLEPSDKSEMVTQVLYGEVFKVLEQRKKWSKIKLAFDDYQGWIDNKQYQEINEDTFKNIHKKPASLSTDLINYISDENNQLYPIPMGANLNALSYLNHQFEGRSQTKTQTKDHLVITAIMYLNTPYLWGGKTPFGIDCSGFTQMVYKLNGYKLLRDASQQATQGQALSFIEESDPGDLAFFDNAEGQIIHVGIIMKDNYIIHAHGKVRIDRLDQTGIYNVSKKQHTHKLRIIKSVI